MSTLSYHLGRITVQAVVNGRGFDVWEAGELIGHRRTRGGADGLRIAHAQALAEEDKRDADAVRSAARDWLGRHQAHAD